MAMPLAGRCAAAAVVTKATACPASICKATRPCYRRQLITSCSLKQTTGQTDQKPQQMHRPALRLAQVLVGAGAAVAGLLGPLLPTWALDSFALDSLATDTSIDPGLGDSPPLLDTLLVVVITYFTVMLLYLWLSSFMDESPQEDSSKQAPGEQGGSELPPGYGSFLDAHVRTYVGPGRQQVVALQDLGQAEPLEGEDMAHLKNRLAAGAAEAMELQLRDCERLVRSKLLARKLGYHPPRAQPSPGSSSNGSSRGAGHGADHQIEDLMLAAVLTSPEGLGSWQQRAAVEALIDQHLDQLLPAGGGVFREDLVVRQVMRQVVQALVVEESLLLLEGTDKATRMMQGGKGRKGQAGDKPWALW